MLLENISEGIMEYWNIEEMEHLTHAIILPNLGFLG